MAKNFPALPNITRDSTDPVAALEAFAEHYPAADIYGMLRFFRDNLNAEIIRRWVRQQIAEEIRGRMDTGGVTYLKARLMTALAWGYTDKVGWSNFNRMADDGWRETFGTEPERTAAAGRK